MINFAAEKAKYDGRLKLPKFRNANVAEVILQPNDGVMKKTFSDSHFSWWRSKSFEVSQAKIIRL